MRTRITSLVIGAMTALLAVAGPVSAGDGKVVITLDVNFARGSETFTATGAFCPRGSAVTTSVETTGRPVFHVEKTFTCKDRSGTLSIALDAVSTWTGTQGGWTVTGGTGAYAGASGGGQVVGVGTSSGILDTYTGTINR
ncbi:MAG TPA: hypothetical protein VFY23_16050 [Candidatus Limnocylindrales bacterium]|nr:hypothetical protein [Candidatus Limnocylindrales bacterium]